MNLCVSEHPDCSACKSPKDILGRCLAYRRNSTVFWAFDIAFGITLGLLLVYFHEHLIPAAWPQLFAFTVSMIAMMILQGLLSFLIGNMIGSMEAMIPSGFVCTAAMFIPYLAPSNERNMLVHGAAIGGAISLCFVFLDARYRNVLIPATSYIGPFKAVDTPRFTLRSPAWLYYLQVIGGARRRAFAQRSLFSGMGREVLFVGAGSGLNFANFPPRRNIMAVDVNAKALRRAQARSEQYHGNITLMEADVQKLPFSDATFDTVACASTFCSVPDPRQGLSELHRVLKPGGRLLMLEHVRSANALIAFQQDMMNIAMRYLGSDLNRNTVQTVLNSGFVVDRIRSAYLDVYLMIEGHKEQLSLS